jgi:hypothetical protein
VSLPLFPLTIKHGVKLVSVALCLGGPASQACSSPIFASLQISERFPPLQPHATVHGLASKVGDESHLPCVGVLCRVQLVQLYLVVLVIGKKVSGYTKIVS